MMLITTLGTSGLSPKIELKMSLRKIPAESILLTSPPLYTTLPIADKTAFLSVYLQKHDHGSDTENKWRYINVGSHNILTETKPLNMQTYILLYTERARCIVVCCTSFVHFE